MQCNKIKRSNSNKKNLSKRHHQSNSQRCRFNDDDNDGERMEESKLYMWGCIQQQIAHESTHMCVIMHYVCTQKKNPLNKFFFSGWMDEKWMKMERAIYSKYLFSYISSLSTSYIHVCIHLYVQKFIRRENCILQDFLFHYFMYILHNFFLLNHHHQQQQKPLLF